MSSKPELLDVDPSTLLIGTNVRKDAHAETLVSSLKSNGMLHPIRARRTEDGLEVIDGQRRTLAAITADMKTVPVLVVETSDHGRVFEQYVSNEAREALTDVDRIRAVQQLALFKLNAGTIAKRTGLTKTIVERAIAIPDTTLELVPDGRLEDLADLAAIEGEPEHDKAAKALAAGDDYTFRDYLRRQQMRVAVEVETAATRAAHPALQILEERPAWDSTRYRSLSSPYYVPPLERVDTGETIEVPIVDLDAGLEQLGVALAVVISGQYGYGGSLTSTTLYVDLDQIEAAGIRQVEPQSTSSVSDEDRARWAAEAEEREQRTKAWLATAEPRKTFIATLMQEKKPRPGWEGLVLEHLFLSDYDALWNGNVRTAIRQMLGLDELDISEHDENWDDDALVALLAELRTRPDRLPFALLATALAVLEEHDLAHTSGLRSERIPGYLDALEKWGYDATEERRIIAEATA